eukprot:CAMPEP_0172545228 /NCGR_PEP_ID=MMETSP1067-20121228/15188_1 /TAXON_ID=265564 ORGANISM="Thalassiosira punctigera, Strain Tpunct2005C2" /NCGR_SAMPLE_ID=MMETSP1067 /ASSEMBLY_ACC=CAM_ASM_000444 /LENGTH=201 /DNA_ID=CAMNT_0013331931 /DNA_START=106 /DNA_END=711 /DNA_ORIENTATION=-
MMKIAAIAALVGSAAAFAPAPAGKASVALNAEMSKSLPFLTNPKNTDGLIGSVGFDPLGWSDMWDIKWLQEAEIKHGRVSMLATVGFVTSQFYTLPMFTDLHQDDSNAVPSAIGMSAMMQIVFFAGAEEWRTNNGKITMENMFEDPARVPGDLGWGTDRLIGKSEEEINKLKLQEIKNGRLAMLAIGGMIHHNFVTGEPLL